MRVRSRVASFWSILAIVALIVALAPAGNGLAAGPSLSLSARKGASGAALRATISGFPASSDVRIRWDGVTIAQGSTNRSGKASITFNGRASAAGQHRVQAVSGQTSVEASFTVVSSLTVSASRVRAGRTLDFTMAGFASNERVSLWFVRGSTERRIGSYGTASSGGRTATITVPAELSSGAWTLTGRGSLGNTASVKVTITGGAAPTATPSPTPRPTQTPTPAPTQPAGGGAVSIWVDPVNGDDASNGSSRSSAVRTLDEAWSRVPSGSRLSAAYRIRLVAGTYPASGLPNYMDARYGTASAPITIEAADGAGTAVLNGMLNIFDVRYLTLSNLVIRTSGDVVHCEQCQYFSILGSTLDGQGSARETLKINQSQYITIDQSDFSGAYDNAIDFVAVQYGTISNSKIRDAEDWCMYVKGGSAELSITGNEIYNCGTGGFTAGQGTGFQFMVSPWITYEAENIDFVGNEIYDTTGAGMGVNGGNNILLAENHLVRVGSRSHLLEIGFGSRSCDGQPGDDGRSRCASYLAAGGWGTTAVDNGENYVRIPNKNVTVRDNVFENPQGYQTQWQHFFIPGPYNGAAQNGSNAPKPAYADDGLVITGNTITNGDASMPLGVGDGQGCGDANPTCNSAQLLADNQINGQ